MQYRTLLLLVGSVAASANTYTSQVCGSGSNNIPDGTGALSCILTVNDAGSIASGNAVTVSLLGLQHEASGDLIVTLTHFTDSSQTSMYGTPQYVLYRIGKMSADPNDFGYSAEFGDPNGTGDNYDFGSAFPGGLWATAASLGAANFMPGRAQGFINGYATTGQFSSAATTFSAMFAGQPLAGVWRLDIADVAAGPTLGSTGSLLQWQLALVNGPPPPASLSIAKMHTGNFTQGQQSATYMVTVSNAANAGPTSGTVVVTEIVPSGLNLVSMTGMGWTCPGTAANNCTRSDALNGGANYSVITVTVSVNANATSPQVNQVSVSGGGSAMASASDSTMITPTNLPPSAVSVTPSSGSGSSQTFSFLFSDPNGYTDLSTTYMLINSVLNWPGSCYTFYDRNANVLWLLNDAGNSLLGPVTPGSASTVQNSQCVLSGAGSTVSGLGNNLIVNVALTFKAAFGGAKNVYLNAQDSGGLWSNWQSLGTWTVPVAGNLPPSNVSVTPSSGNGSSQTFSFVFSDPNGYTDLSTTYMLINSTLNWPGSCYTFYDRNANVLWLLNDAGNSLLGPVMPGSATTVQNSQCTLNGAGSTVSGLGNNLTVNVALTFTGAFGGAKNVYLNAQDSGGLWSNWQSLGTWTVPAAGNLPPSNVSVTPSSGSGSSQTFSFVFSDPNGYTDLSTTYMLINSVLNWPGSCYTFYDRNANVLWLLNDAGNSLLGPVTPGNATTVQNSQCTLSGTGSTVSGLANNLTVNVALTFKAAFGGAKNVYLNTQDSGGLWSNWQSLGTWTVPVAGNLPPSNVSVTPSSGSGSSQTFSFVFSDPNGYTDLSTTYMLINSVLNWPGSCYTFYDRNANVLWLLNDAGNFLLGPVTPGSATTVQNSQCTLSGTGSTVSGLGNNLTVNVALTFKAAFGGAKNVYLNAQDSGGLWSNWQSLGIWTAQ